MPAVMIRAHGPARTRADDCGCLLQAATAARRPAATRVQPLVELAPRGARALLADRRERVGTLSKPRARAGRTRRLGGPARQTRVHGRIPGDPPRARSLHGGQLRQLVQPTAPREAEGSDRLLL